MSLETSTLLNRFHPAVAAWFVRTFEEPTAPQRLAWPAIMGGGHALIAAPTGSGKTLAAFLAAIDGLVRRSLSEGLPDAVDVVYVSPLKALSNDIQKNLEAPLAGISAELVRQGSPSVEIRALLRTGDTKSAARAAMLRRPPHILVTTPESLYVLLTSDGGRRLLAPTRTVIVDEIHAVASDKRGSHLALSLERLEDLVCRHGGALTRIGLSATQKPIEEVARLLVGRADDGHPRPCSIVDVGHARNLDLAIEIPPSPLGAITPNEVSSEAYDRLAELITQHQTTLVFANTRRQAERVARHLEERLAERPSPNGHDEIQGAERPCPNGHHEIRISAHHGSLSRERRLAVEDRLKRGELRALVATSSLELGIDIGSIDLVCQLGSTRTIATLLQRAGRAGHSVGGLPKARLFPLTLGELGECAALLLSIRRGELDRLRIPEAPLDILAQQIVAEVAAGERQEDDLFRVFRRAEPFARLPRETFDRLFDDLATGYASPSVVGGRRGAHLHRDLVQRVLRPRRGARLAAMTSGGAIPDNSEFQVVLEPQGAVIGSVHEDFAAESLAGDVFLLGSSAWRIQKIEQGRVLVEDARGQAPGLPFWFGEAPARSPELSMSLCRLREIAIDELRAGSTEGTDDSETNEARVIARWRAETGIEADAAGQIMAQYAEGYAELGTLPTRTILVAERFFDEAGDQHLVLHAPFGSRINRAWGLALRKRFCRTFNFELQAAADEDSVVLSLGPTHSFPLADVFRFLSSGTVRAVLVQALLDAPMFGIRWRWNAARSLAIPRFRGGKRTPPFFQRQLAEDLAAVLFPDQLACLENIAGDREIPDHPLVTQTIHDCLTESMDIDGLEAVLRAIERGEIECVARDLPTPSVFAEAILHARPYAFLDDAPLEERRTQSVRRRRRLPRDPSLVTEMSDAGQLDPEAIARVEDEAWPVVESADELADALGLSGFVTESEGLTSGWESYLAELVRAGRAVRVLAPPGEDVWIAIERAAEHRALVPERQLVPSLQTLPSFSRLAKSWTDESACAEILRSRLTILGPRTARELGEPLGLSTASTTAALAVLEAQGVVFRGHFRHIEPPELEWCDRRLLARIHRQTLERLRREIEPVAPADFARFLFEWQRVTHASRGRGPEALAATLSLLEGFTAAAAAWEEAILPARLADYEPEALDALCFGGRLIWCRANPPSRTNNAALGRGGPVRATPIVLLPRESAAFWLANAEGESPAPPALLEDSEAEAVRAVLARRGASFASDLAAATGLLPNRVERALGVLVAAGLATADGFAGLRALIGPSALLDARVRAKVVAQRRRAASAMSATSGLGVSRVGVPSAIERGGRWSLLEPRTSLDLAANDVRVEHITRRLLARYGVVFRRVVEREELLPPWREILTVLRRLEARGEIRGGRFVDGFSGEQYALPEAVAALRNVRKAPKTGELIVLSAADPLNLIHLLAPNESAPAALHCRILFRDGVPLAIREGKEIRFLVAMDPAERWLAETTLRRLGPGPSFPSPVLASHPA